MIEYKSLIHHATIGSIVNIVMFRSVKVLHFTVAMLCCFNAVIGYSSILVTNDELRDNACIVNDNKTLRNEFMATARENSMINGSCKFNSRQKYI